MNQEETIRLTSQDDANNSIDDESLDADSWWSPVSPGGNMGRMFRDRTESAQEVLADRVDEQFSDSLREKKGISYSKLAMFIFLGIVGFFLFKLVFPDMEEMAKNWGKWANDVGWQGAFLFTIGAGLIMLVPGVPGSLLCFCCGMVFPSFYEALLVAVVAHHLGACLAFGIAHWCFRKQFEKLVRSRPTLHAMSVAASMEEYKVTFLSRFIVMPVQLKNYLFGVLPVSFGCFFFMALLGDFQSALFTVYLGSVSNQIIVESSKDSEDGSQTWDAWFQKIIPISSIVVAAAMTTFASLVARKAYLRVLDSIPDLENRANSGDVEMSLSTIPPNRANYSPRGNPAPTHRTGSYRVSQEENVEA